jgi:L-fuconolactonase
MTGLPASVRIVDSHVHIWPRGLRHPSQLKAGPLDATPADLISRLDASGVDAVIVSPAMLVYPDNAYVLKAAQSDPRRILAVVGIDPRDPESARSIPALAASGAIGVRVNTGATPLESAEHLASLDRLVEAAASAGLVIQWTIPLAATALIERAAVQAPDTPQILDHLGLPSDFRDVKALDRIRELALIPTLTVKLSGMYALSKAGYPYRDTWPWAEGVIAAFSPERTMWASDWPLAGESASYSENLALVSELPFLHDAARDAILRGTAVRVWHAARASRQ